MKRNTGARGLRAIMEDFMGDLMFDLPSRSDVKKVIINKAFTSGSGEPVLILRDPQEIKDLAEQANERLVGGGAGGVEVGNGAVGRAIRRGGG